MKTAELPSIIENRRLDSPAVTPQALAWHSNRLWLGSRDLRRIYEIEPETWSVVTELEAPGIPWAAVSTGDAISFTIGDGEEDDRYVQRFIPKKGFSLKDRFACPDLTGSYLSFDGEHLHLSQWYKHLIFKLDGAGKILRTFDLEAEICGHVFVGDSLFVLRGTEQGDEDWRIARFDPREETPAIIDLARVPFACRSLAFDGANFWTNHRAAHQTVSFGLPGRA